jgi:hypothetical protein
VENFLVESWAEYLRQRERMTVSDLAVRDKVAAFQRSGEPTISRMVYTPAPGERERDNRGNSKKSGVEPPFSTL